MEVDVRELHTGTRVQRASDPFQRQKMMIEEEEAEEEEHRAGALTSQEVNPHTRFLKVRKREEYRFGDLCLMAHY